MANKFNYKIEKSEDRKDVLELKTTTNGYQWQVVEIPLIAVADVAADLAIKKVMLEDAKEAVK